MQLFFEPNIAEDSEEFVLNKDEARHCLKVLRKKSGDTIHVVDGRGNLFTCIINSDALNHCNLKVIKKISEPPTNYKLHVAIAPTKNLDRMEWLIEKLVEVGVNEVSFLLCKNSERRHLKTDRLYKKAVSAMKQSLKSALPKINELILYDDFVNIQRQGHCFIAYVDENNPCHLSQVIQPHGEHIVLIGPEGDFSNDELRLAIDNHYQKVSLGKSRLRTETAALVATTIIHTLNHS